MKICFYLQRRFAYIGHTMMTVLKERYRVDDFCGYVSVREGYEFLRNQKDIAYSELILEEDVLASFVSEPLDREYLNALEKEYGIPNLWPYLTADRIIRYNLHTRAYPADTSRYTHEEMMRMVQVTARAVISFLEKEKPNVIVFSVVGSLSSTLLYHIARKKGIKTLVIDSPRIGVKYFLSERDDRSTFLEETFAKAKADPSAIPEEYHREARAFLSEFQEKPSYFLKSSEASTVVAKSMDVKRRGSLNFLSPKNTLRSLRFALRTVASYLANRHKDDYSTVKPWYELWDKLVRKVRTLWGYDDLYDTPVPGETYSFFALHSEPEAHPMVLAPFYIDQLWVAKQIARSLPLSHKLYIKDHPVMVGFRPRSYYKELKKIPNMRLISPAVSSLALMAESKLTLTVTGSAGWEALLLKKPVITFGPINYSSLSGVKLCSDINCLPQLVKEQLERFSYNEGELLLFIASALLESVDADFVQLWEVEAGTQSEKNKERLAPFVDLLAQKCGLARRTG